MNTRLREKSEEKLTETRQKLMDDAGARQQDMSSLREVIRDSLTLHSPPKSMYSQSNAFRFPSMSTVSLTGDEVELKKDGLFSEDQWTLLGLSGNQLAQPMVDSWLESASAWSGP